MSSTKRQEFRINPMDMLLSLTRITIPIMLSNITHWIGNVQHQRQRETRMMRSKFFKQHRTVLGNNDDWKNVQYIVRFFRVLDLCKTRERKTMKIEN